MRDQDIKSYSQFLKEFQDETDRGAALVGAVMIDDRLEHTLRGFMVESKISEELLEGAFAPLSSFSARIKMSYALGLINDYEFHNCELIRRIRNKFAHEGHGISFATQQVSAWCDSFTTDLPTVDEMTHNARSKFINAVVLISLQLFYRGEWVAKERCSTKSWDRLKK